MVKAIRKPNAELFETVKPYKRVLVVGCGGCTSVCMAGGQRESLEVAEELAAHARHEHVPQQYTTFVTERQCNPEFLEDLRAMAGNCDCMLSLACGAGAQHAADAFPAIPVFPGLDTAFVGADMDVGLYEERCRTCGQCMLAYTGGICPVTRCAKSLFNGPCGGTRDDGTCEVGTGARCAWQDIHDRLKAQGRLASLLVIRPPLEWIDKGPAALIQRGFEGRYPKHGQEAGR
jgi:ferredoxin